MLRKLLVFLLVIGVGIGLLRVRDQRSQPPALEVWLLDIGQGESILLREPSGKTLLFDGGPDDSVLSQIGQVLPPWQGKIDLIVSSHNHSDHIRGLIAVMQRYAVGEAWDSGASAPGADYAAYIKELAAKRVPARAQWFDISSCTALDVCPPKIPFGQAVLQVYHPLRNATGDHPKDQHDDTLAIRASYANQSILLTGDLDEAHELRMVAACKPPRCTLASTLLQAPHHGSAYGMLPAFLAAVHPKTALIPVGLNNKFGHPAPATMQKLGQSGVPVLRTDTMGRQYLRLMPGRPP